MEVHPTEHPRALLSVTYDNVETDQRFTLNFQPRWDATKEEITEILRTVMFAMGYDVSEVNESFPSE